MKRPAYQLGRDATTLSVATGSSGTVSRVKIAISTSGGDAPGLNAAVEGAARAAHARGWEVVGITDGLDGLLFPDRYPDGAVVTLDAFKVRGIAARAGTLLGAASDSDPLAAGVAPIVAGVAAAGIDALVCVGGDGTQRVAYALAQAGVAVVGVPKTIDKDLVGTEATLGFDTAVDVVAESLDRLRSTLDAHRRAMVIEVMGRDTGWLALHGGLAGGADAICIPEIPFDPSVIADLVTDRHRAGARSTLIVVGEGAHPISGAATVSWHKNDGSPVLGGVAEQLADAVRDLVEPQVRHLVLGHLVRGGSPVGTDRVHGLRLGAAAVASIAAGRHGHMVSWDGSKVLEVDLGAVAGRTRPVPLDDPTLAAARAIGICFADRHAPQGSAS
jgi:ATP-dependent phosphofructokinase / diphosphate-dependent phosphofructokinase